MISGNALKTLLNPSAELSIISLLSRYIYPSPHPRFRPSVHPSAHSPALRGDASEVRPWGLAKLPPIPSEALVLSNRVTSGRCASSFARWSWCGMVEKCKIRCDVKPRGRGRFVSSTSVSYSEYRQVWTYRCGKNGEAI